MRKIFQILFMATLLAVSALAAAADFNNEGYIEAEGFGPPDQPASAGNPHAAMRRVAIMDAYRYLAEEAYTLYVSANTTVEKSCLIDDTVKSKVDAALKGAKVISAKGTLQEGYIAIVRLPIYGGPGSLASAVLSENVQVEDFPKPKVVPLRSEVNYTGLVIDCRGQSLSTAIAPAIKSADGREIYAYKNIGYQNAVNTGMVEYSANLDSPRAGSTPLVVKAVKISDKCDVVVSDEDADKILYANQSTNFLINCAVVLVR